MDDSSPDIIWFRGQQNCVVQGESTLLSMRARGGRCIPRDFRADTGNRHHGCRSLPQRDQTSFAGCRNVAGSAVTMCKNPGPSFSSTREENTIWPASIARVSWKESCPAALRSKVLEGGRCFSYACRDDDDTRRARDDGYGRMKGNSSQEAPVAPCTCSSSLQIGALGVRGDTISDISRRSAVNLSMRGRAIDVVLPAPQADTGQGPQLTDKQTLGQSEDSPKISSRAGLSDELLAEEILYLRTEYSQYLRKRLEAVISGVWSWRSDSVSDFSASHHDKPFSACVAQEVRRRFPGYCVLDV